MSGIKHGGNRPKMPKNLRAAKTKKLSKDPEALAKYEFKIRARRARKLKKNRLKK